MNRLLKRRIAVIDNKGYTLVEAMLVMLITSIAFVGIIKGFSYMSEGLMKSRRRSTAVNLAKEQIEILKKKDYDRIYTTSQTDVDSFTYDNSYFVPETFQIGSITYTRTVLVTKMEESGSQLVELSPSDPDAGIRRLKVRVMWSLPNTGTTKDFVLYNYRRDPTRAKQVGSIAGIVKKKSDYSLMEGVTVLIVENPNWNTTTDASGEFEVGSSTGMWTLRVSYQGYYDIKYPSVTVSEGVTTQIPVNDLLMEKMAVGWIEGIVKSTTGVPIEGAIISCDDFTSQNTVSLSTSAFGPTQNFLLNNVSTGTSWTISASSGAPFNMSGSTIGIQVLDSAATVVEIVLDTTTIYGSVSGSVDLDGTGDDSGIKVTCGGGNATTNTSGNFRIDNIMDGDWILDVNPDIDNPSYTSDRSSVTITAGQTTDAGSFILYPAGSVSGIVYAPGGADPYPGIIIEAEDGTVLVRGEDVSAGDGSYILNQLPIFGNTYTIQPVLDDEDISTPASINVNMVQGVEDTANDFTITPAWGYIEGTVTDNSEPITTGVIVVASTFAIAASVPDIPLGDEGIYAGITYSAGNYSLKVRNDYTYYVYAWYTSITDFNSGTTSTTRLQDTSITLSGTPPTATVDFSW